VLAVLRIFTTLFCQLFRKTFGLGSELFREPLGLGAKLFRVPPFLMVNREQYNRQGDDGAHQRAQEAVPDGVEPVVVLEEC
jgi:hypothetical protein